MNRYRSQLLVLCMVVTLSVAYLDVYIPECARLAIPGEMEESLANFGFIPYGQTLIGKLFVPQGEDNAGLCTIEGEKPIKLLQGKAFMLIKRGTCKFTQKVLNAQRLGADMAVIYDNQPSQQVRTLMNNDGHGHLVEIASVYISGKMGETLINTLKNCSSVTLRQTFEVFEREVVSLELWLSLSNRESYILLRDLQMNDYLRVIEQSVDTAVKFKVNYGCQNLYCQQADCIGSVQNQYCLPVRRHVQEKDESDQLVSGSQLLMESLRMFFLFEMMPMAKNDIWYKYMGLFDKNICFTVQDIQTCSYETMAQSGVSAQTINGIKSLIEQTLIQINAQKFSENNVFYKMQAQAGMKNILFYPEAVVNGKNFYGLFKAEEVFEMICSSLISQPKECIQFMRNQPFSDETLDVEENLWLTVAMIVLLMTVGFVLALVVYSRVIKKEMGQKMSVEINKVVENYVTLVETKRNSEVTIKNDEEMRHDAE